MNCKLIFNLPFVSFSILILCSCSVVEMSGTMTRKTGEVMEDYSKKNDGFVGKMAGVGGQINTSVGSTVEDIAKNGASGNSDKSKTEQFTEANKKVLNSAIDSVSEENSTQSNTTLQAQKKLTALGYDPGPIDGIMGNKTKVAIGDYQKSKNLNVTNLLDKQTLSSLSLDSIE